MAVVSPCPDVPILRQLALGRMPPAEVERLAEHCERCERCIQLLHTLTAEDTLVEAMAAQGTIPERPHEPAVDALIQRLKLMRPPSAPEAGMTVSLAEATVGVPGEDRVPLPSQPAEDTFAGLSPAQGPGEVGRLGGYRVLKLLGAGGMGMVYQAEDVQLQRAVALKVMKAEVAKNPTARERFLREARAAARLKSDHVVSIYQVGEDRDVVFLAMEFLEGLSLEDWLKKGRTPTLAQAARIGRQIALGLAEAHACGLIHRDIKPGNVWLDSRQQGRVKLLDFGLARGGADEHQLTQSGAILGTPAFMAPEQARGEKVDHRVDLFSLGVVLYRLTTGRLPFRGDNTMSVLMSLATDTPAPPREINPAIPPRMAALIERLLAKDREQRPAMAKAVADELAILEREAAQPAVEERTVVGAATVRERSASTAPSRSRLRWLVAASLLLLLGGVAAAIVVIIRDKQGNKIAEVNVPPGGSAEIKDNTKNKEEAKKQPAAKEEKPRGAVPLAPLLPGTPLSPVALVQQPAKLPGVRSWSIESRNIHQPAAMAYSPDGKRLAVACAGGVFRIWEPESGRLVQVLLESDSVGTMAWSPDGRTLALGCRGKQPVRLWDAETGRFLRRLEAPAPGSSGSTLAWTDDGRKVRAVMHGLADCHTWNASDGKLLGTVRIPYRSHATFSPNGKQLAGLRADGRLAVWDVETGKEVRQLGTPKSDLSELAWSPKGDRLASAEAKGLHVWDIESGKESFTYSDAPWGGGVAWSPDGRRVVYNLGNNTGVARISLEPAAKPERLEDIGDAILAWSPDGKSIAGLSGNNNLRLYDAASGKRLRWLSEGAWGAGGDSQFAISPAGRMIALSERSGRTFLSSMDSGQIAAVLKESYGPLAWSPDGKTLAKGGPNHTVDLWDDGGQTRIKLMGHQADVSYLAWSPDGKRLASSSDFEKRVLLWDTEKVEKLRELGPFAREATAVKWSLDGRLLAFNVPSVGWHIWDVEQNKLVNNPKEWKDTVLVFSPDNRSALVGSYGVAYRLRDCTTGKELRSLPVGVWPNGMGPAWSPDGRLLAVPVSWGVELWRGDLSRRVRTLPVAYPEVYQIAFSPDGKWTFARAGERLHVWETDTGRLSGILLVGEKNNGLTITADGHYNGNEQVERGIVMVVQKDDGTQEVLEPADFEQKYGRKNEPDKVHLLQPLPPSPYPLPGMPMGPNALVREPAELPDANAMSWTVETVNSRGSVNAVAYRPDGKLLATGGDDGTIRLWDTSSGKLVRMLIGEPVGSLSWSKDGKVLTALRPGDVQGREWDADTGRLLRRVLGAVTPGSKTARSPDGKQTVTADDKGVRITDSATGKVLQTLEETGHIGYHNCSWSPDGRRLAFAYQFPGENGLRVVEATTGRSGPALAEYDWAGSWSPDGKIFATCGHDGRAHLLAAGTYRLLRTLEGDGFDGTALAWSADGKRLATSAHSAVRVWSVQTGKQLWRKDKRANAVAWSPDGRRLATTDNNNDKAALRLWEAENGKLLREHPLIAEGALAWRPDGKRLVALPTWGEEGLMIDAETGAVHRKLKAGLGNCCVRWSSDGKTFTSLGSRGQLREWDAATGEARRTTQLPGVVGYLSSAAWSPDGLMLAWASGDAIHLNGVAGEPLGVLMPLGPFAQLAVSADGHYRGNARVERAIRMVVQKRDGTTETLTSAEFERKYHFKNEPATVRLIDK